MQKKFIIFAPDYNANSGGAIATHKLCHLINELGREAFLFPMFDTHPINILNFEATIRQLNKELYHFGMNSSIAITKQTKNAWALSKIFNRVFKIFFPLIKSGVAREALNSHQHSLKTNPIFNTPCIDIHRAGEIKDDDNCIVIYPEVVMGNPLNAKYVVRWLLHTPGFHTKSTNYGLNELYFRFSIETPNFNHPGSKTSDQFLTVVHFPTEIYNMNGVSQERNGTAYCIRKGAGKKIVHDLNNSICIDDKSHEEIAAIFKSVRTFYCYDTRTAFYYFSSLCGCETIVIPDDGICEEEWLPDPASRIGIRYGMESDTKFSQSTPDQVLNFLKHEETLSIERVKNVLAEIDALFK